MGSKNTNSLLFVRSVSVLLKTWEHDTKHFKLKDFFFIRVPVKEDTAADKSSLLWPHFAQYLLINTALSLNQCD